MAKIISMMRDNLEKFVNQNREEFDRATPNFTLWDNIEKQLDNQSQEKMTPAPLKAIKPKRTVRMRVLRYASVAAIGLLLLTVGGVIGSYFTSNSMNEVASSEIALSDISDEYAEVEAHYTSQINSNIEKLKDYDYDKVVLEDIEELDAAFQELKRELGNSNLMSDEEIIQAMIENYQTKVEILERVIERTPKKNKSKSEKTEI